MCMWVEVLRMQEGLQMQTTLPNGTARTGLRLVAVWMALLLPWPSVGQMCMWAVFLLMQAGSRRKVSPNGMARLGLCLAPRAMAARSGLLLPVGPMYI